MTGKNNSGVIKKWVVPARMVIDNNHSNVVEMAFTVWSATGKGAQRKIQDRINQKVGEASRFANNRSLLDVVKGIA